MNIFEQLQFDPKHDDSLSESKVSARKQYYGLICSRGSCFIRCISLSDFIAL